MATLGTRIPEIPTVIAYPDDGQPLIGEAAERRAMTEPERVAREFKRRVGDPVPFIVAGSPRSAETLMALVLRSVIATVSNAEGAPPSEITVTHPASWGPYKTAQLDQIFQLAGCPGATTMTEPEAAARHYAAQERLEPGSTIAVFDFGGGTFDAAILHNDLDGSYELIGEAQGLERLGGIDLDHALFHRVVEHLELELSDLDDTPANRNAIARLRSECVTAKETLSTDTATTVPVMLPENHTEVRLTRREFEEMIRPAVVDAITAIDGTISAAGLDAEDLTAILLVGGSSRIPLVSQLVSQHFNRPTLVDAHPKHAVAAGAALSVEPTTIVEAATPQVAADSTASTPVAEPSISHESAVPSLLAEAPSAAEPRHPRGQAEHLSVKAKRSVGPRLGFAVALVALVASIGAAWVLLAPNNEEEAPAGEAMSSTTAVPASAESTSTTALVTTPPTTASPVAQLIGDDIGRTAYNGIVRVASLPDRGPSQPPQLAWQTASDLFTGPVGLGDAIFVSHLDESGIPHIAALDADTGTQLWVSDLPQVGTILVTDQVVVVHWIHGFRFHDPTTGELIDEVSLPWNFGTGTVFISAADLRDGRIYAAGGYGEGAEATSFVVAIDLETGKPAWTHEDQSLGWSATDQTVALATDGSTIVLGGPNALVALDNETGTELWRSFDLTGRTGFHLDGGVLVTWPEPTVNRGVDARTGETIWEFVESTFPKYASDGTNFYIVSNRSQLQARRLATGDLVWKADGPSVSGLTTPTIAIGGDIVYLIHESGPTAAFQLSSGQLIWSGTLEGLSADAGIGLFPVSTASGRLLVLQDQTVNVYG